MSFSASASGTPRRLLWLVALVYTTFVIYGSLVPFDFHPLPWDQAVARFSAIPYLKLGVGSRADWVANLILYIPVGYLLMGVWVGWSRSLLVLTVGAILSGFVVAGLALSIEFAQLFFPPRTVSLNDLYAEWAGGALGMLLWSMAGRPLSRLWHRYAQGGPRAVRAALQGYVLIYLFLSFFPYDFMMGAEEWRARLAPDKAGWLFAGSCGLGCWMKLVPEMLAAVPFGLLWASRPGRLSLFAAAGFGVLLGLTVEILQLCIASGISQGASVFSRAVGVVLGASFPFLFANWDGRRMRPWVRGGLLLATVPYAGGLAWLNHWFVTSWGNSDAAMARLADIHFLPFYYHYYTSEAVALTSLVFQFGLYAPLGAGVWLWYEGAWYRSRGGWLSVLIGMLAAFVIEAGKLFVPGQHPDPTNVLIAAGAAGLCHALLSRLFPAGQSSRPAQHSGGFAPAVEPADLPEPVKANTRTAPPARLFALGLLIAAVLSVLGYPLGWMPLLLLLVLAAICWRWPGSWLIVVPAALPLLDFAYLSGRLFWSEFDTMLLLALAIGYSRERDNPAMAWPGRLPLAIYAASALIGLVSGVLPLAPLDFNAFTHYTSPYNALHAVKGLAFALAFLPLVKSEWHKNESRFTARLAWGMTLGLASELLYVLWERATFSGLWNFDTDYRITGSFPGMSIGGASIEAYLVLAAPFVWLWAWPRQRVWAMLLAGGLYALAAYGVMVTFSRGGQAAFVVATLLTLTGYARLTGKTRKQGMAGILFLLVGVVAASLVAWPIVSGKFSQARLATIQADAGVRIAHWKDALGILSEAGNLALGAGSGSFPASFYWYSSAPSRPGTYAFVKQGDNVFLRLGGGETLYFEQVVPIKPGHTYRILLDLRSSSKSAALTVPVCEKALLYSFTCSWNTLKLSSGDGQWQRQEIRVSTKRFGPPGSWLQRPVKLTMFNPGSTTLVDVDNVALFDETGRNLVRNGDFSQGMQGWFFSTDSHLAWHAKNLFVHVLFEQGLLGLGAFVALLGVAGLTLLRRSGRDAMALTLLVSLTSFLIVGLIDSLIDEPRLDFLFFLLLGIALISGGKVLPHRRKSRRSRSSPTGHEVVIQS
jgi:glycopeptide antibiotics resistance protein/O-antigen ligase